MGYVQGNRSQLRAGSREFLAGVSIRQEVASEQGYYDETAPPQGLRGFFNFLDDELAGLFPAHDAAGSRRIRSNDGYKLYDDPYKQAITIAERGVMGRAADRARLRWQPKDVGRLRGRLANQLAVIRQELELPLDELPIVLNAARRVGDRKTEGKGRKLALLPRPGDVTAEYLSQAAHAATIMLEKEIPGYVGPQPYLPHLTVACMGRQIHPKQVGEAAERLDEHVQQQPLTIYLGSVIVTGYDQQMAVIGYPRP